MGIVNFISSWLKDIVVLFILISIAELVMPKGNMKRYIDLIIGFLIIFTIITPFARIIKKDFSFDETVFNYSNSIIMNNKDDINFQIEQEKQIEKLYKEKIKDEIIKLVEEESSYMVEDVILDLIEDDEVYGKIKDLEIIIKNGKEDIRENKISIEKVENIEINQESDIKSNDYEYDYIELKKIISTRYNIEKDKITMKEYE